MSTNENPRPLSRRSIITTGGAALATAGATLPALATAPDPVLALVAAERAAWEAFGAAGQESDGAEQALMQSPWDRKPRVLIGEYTTIASGPDLDPVPLEERTAEPVYAHDHAAIDRDCDAHACWPASCAEAVEERRARLHRELDADAAAIAAAPEVVRHGKAEERWSEAHNAWRAAARVMVAAVPTTAAGLIAQIEAFEAYTKDCMVSHAEDGLTDLLANVRAFVAGRA